MAMEIPDLWMVFSWKPPLIGFVFCFFPLPPLMTLEGTWRFLTKKGPQFPSVKTMPPGDAFTCNARGWSGDHGLTNRDIYSMIIYVQPSRIHQYRGFLTVLGFKLHIICSEIKTWLSKQNRNIHPKSRAKEASMAWIKMLNPQSFKA